MPRIKQFIPSSRAMPATVADLEAQRIVKPAPKLIDQLDEVYAALYEDPDFRALRGADEPEETVEGSIQDDDTRAAEMMRNKGIEMKKTLITPSTKLHDIRLKMRGVERRFNVGRKVRSQAAAQAAE